MTTLQRRHRALVTEAMFIRPRNPDDHAEFEWLLPQCTPLFVYADEDGRDWVRWELPQAVAEKLGWGAMRCACCNARGQLVEDSNVFHVDTAEDEVDWYLGAWWD